VRRLAVVVLALLPVVVLSALAGRAVVAATAAPEPAVPVAAAMGPQSGTLNRLDGRAGEGLLWLLPGDDGVALAPDGRRIAFSSGRDGNREIYVADAATGELTRVTRSPGREDVDPAWSPGGALLAWAAAGRTGRHDLWIAQPSGRAARRVLARPADDAEPDWAPDGRSLAFASDVGGD
jgi:dipeptidyl aminopeptidase/acylaminoacyl peptidase